MRKGRKWTEEQKEALRQKMAAKANEKLARQSKVAEVVSVEGTSAADLARLRLEIADLHKKLEVSERKRSEAEQKALDSADAQGSYLSPIPIEEIPTGEMITVKRLDPKEPYRVVGHKEDGRDILRPNFVDVKVPTFYYKIWMPPIGGTDLKINGDAYYHGTVYKFDLDTLRSVKDIVWRTWAHDKSIHNDEENAYRKQTKIDASIPGALSAAIAATQQRLRG